MSIADWFGGPQYGLRKQAEQWGQQQQENFQGVQTLNDQARAGKIAAERQANKISQSDALRRQTFADAARNASLARGGLSYGGASQSALGRAYGDIFGAANRQTQGIEANKEAYLKELGYDLENQQRAIMDRFNNFRLQGQQDLERRRAQDDANVSNLFTLGLGMFS